mgnify:CR=1 FL=1
MQLPLASNTSHANVRHLKHLDIQDIQCQIADKFLLPTRWFLDNVYDWFLEKGDVLPEN